MAEEEITPQEYAEFVEQLKEALEDPGIREILKGLAKD